jgi:hypothetical protein
VPSATAGKDYLPSDDKLPSPKRQKMKQVHRGTPSTNWQDIREQMHAIKYILPHATSCVATTLLMLTTIGFEQSALQGFG